MRPRLVLPWLVTAALLVGGGSARTAGAQDATVVMTADATQVTRGDTFELRVRAEVTGSDIDRFELPDLSAFRVVSRRVSRPLHFQFGFGNQQQIIQATTLYRFTLQALQPGRYEIEPARIHTAGSAFTSNPLTIVVTDSDSAHVGDHGANAPGGSLEPPPGAHGDTAAVDGAEYDSEAFLRTVVDEAEPYVGEQVTATVYLYVRGSLRSAPVIGQEPTADGFWVHDLLPPSRNLEASRQVVRGVPYRVYVLRRFAAFPLRPGELTIGAMKVSLQTGSVFDVFGRGAQGLDRASVPVAVTARALPDPDRQNVPVGRYELEASLDRTQVPTGDAVTLTATARGTGNVRDVRLELAEPDGLRVLTPQTRDRIEAPGDVVGGERVFEWLLVPDEPGTYRLPRLGFDYFDPRTARYERVEAEPLELMAAGRAIGDAVPAREETGREHQDEPSFGPIRTRSELEPARPPLSNRPWYALALAVPPLAWLGMIGFGLLRRRAEERGAAAAPRRAVRSARRQLSSAHRLAAAGDARAFYGEVASALRSVLEARLGAPVGGLTHTQLVRHLRDHGMAADLANRLIDELEGTDFARFSAAGVSPEEMDRCLERARALIERLEKFEPSQREDP